MEKEIKIGNRKDLSLANRILENPRNRLIILGTIFGWGSDLFSIALFGAWRYNNIFLTLAIWPVIWITGYYIGDVVKFLIWFVRGSEQNIGKLPKIIGYGAVGLTGIAAEILSVNSGNLNYSTKASYAVLINGNPLPVIALIGWPITALLVCIISIELYSWFNLKWNTVKTFIATSLCTFLSLIVLNLLYVFTAGLNT
ncbi:MAG: hypothetical protein Q7T34_02535 [Candidatus Parcubacteria bacterium]|nr:hypothetical protein [Candidatus Parcubacteria bacterium]